MANDPIRVKIPCRICFVKLAEPVKNDLSGKFEYSVECRIPKDDTKTINMVRSAMKKACIEKFGDKPSKWPVDFREDKFFETHLSKNGKDGFFLRTGDVKDAEDYHGHVFFTARASAKEGKKPMQPTCGKLLGEGKWARLTGDRIEAELYSGCYAEVVFDVAGYDSEKSKGVGAYLKTVMKAGEGERMGGGAPVNMEEYFGNEEPDAELDAGNSDDELDV